MWLYIILILAVLQIVLVGLAILLKANGDKYWFLALIPIYGIRCLGRLAGMFTILTVPVKKCFLMFIELMVVAFLCGLYANWGYANLATKGSSLLMQIMIIPIGVCLLIMYLSVVKATLKILYRYGFENKILSILISITILPIPFIFFAIRKNTPSSIEAYN